MEIRYITPDDDRRLISRIYEESWGYAYKGIVPQEYLDSIPAGRWVPNIDLPDRKTILCVENGKLIGTSTICKSRFDEFPDYGEIISIYLLPDFMGKGYGKSLMDFAIRELYKDGYHDVFLWVLEENNRARRFYERYGFREGNKKHEDIIGGKVLWEIAYIYTETNKELSLDI